MYQNTVCVRLLRFVWFTAMHVVDMVRLLYEAPRDLTICVQRLCGHPYANVSQQAVQILTAVVPKCRLRQSSPLGVVYCHAHFCNCTLTVRGATAPPSLRTRHVAPVRHVHTGDVRICTAGVRKHRWRKSDLVSEVHCHASFRNPTPTVRSATGSPHLCTVDFRIFEKSHFPVNLPIDDLNKQMLRKQAFHHECTCIVTKSLFP